MIFLPVFIGIYLTTQTYTPPKGDNLIPVAGLAQIDKGNYYDFRKTNSKRPLSLSELVAVKGKVKAGDFNAKVSIKEISQKKIKTSTNKDGKFTFHLKPGIYTFFILKKDKGYLNRFDGYGYFKTTKVDKPIKNLILIDDENVLN